MAFSTGSAAMAEQVLRRGLGSEPLRTLQGLQGASTVKLRREIMEGLVRVTPDLTIEGGVASRWEVSPDGLTYNFALRPDARWSDGAPVTAEQFLDSQPLFQVTAPDAAKVTIRLARPDPTFLYRLSEVYPRHPQFSAPSGTSLSADQALVGNGPFTVASWQPQSQIVLVRSPTYWGRDAVALDKVIYLPIEDPAEEWKRFQRGDLDITADIPEQPLSWLVSQGGERLSIGPWKNTAFLRINRSRDGWVKEARARRALSLAIDRAVIASHASGDRIKAVTTLVGGTVIPFEHQDPPADWPATQSACEGEARRLWESLGATRPAKIRVSYVNKIYTKRTLLAIGSMWKKQLGVEMVLVPMPLSAFVPALAAGDYEIALTSVGGLDAVDYLQPFAAGKTDADLREAQITADPERRADLLQSVESQILSEGFVIPIARLRSYHFKASHVRGFGVTAIDETGSRDIRLTR